MSKPRILLIEDDEALRRALAALLDGSGYEVVEAANGRIALDAMRQQPTDLVITDLVMPEMEGIETIRILRRDFPTVKIIAISGGGRISGELYLKIADKLGPEKTLAKPFALQDLLGAVRELLAQS